MLNPESGRPHILRQLVVAWTVVLAVEPMTLQMVPDQWLADRLAIADDGDGDGDGGDGDGGDGDGGDGGDGDGDGDGGDGGDGDGSDGDGDGDGDGGKGEDDGSDQAEVSDDDADDSVESDDDSDDDDSDDDGRGISEDAADSDDADEGDNAGTGTGSEIGNQGEARFESDEILAIDLSRRFSAQVESLGFRLINRTRLERLGFTVMRLQLPRGLDARSARQLLAEFDIEEVDLNHLYQPEAGDEHRCAGPACNAWQAIGWPRDARWCGAGQQIGLVDTRIDAQQPGLNQSRVKARDFTNGGHTNDSDNHGTAVASVLLGRADGPVPGLMPAASLSVASVFETTRAGQSRSNALAIIRALDWLVGQSVSMIAMPLSGPANRILEKAVARVIDQGIIVVAAAGNGGPNAPPAYPAAIGQVIAVTAADAAGQAYRRANRGDYIDFTAPGVDVWTLGADGQAQFRSGTSFAVPYATAVISETIAAGLSSPKAAMTGRGLATRDLGVPGHDPVYGKGLLRLTKGCEPRQ